MLAFLPPQPISTPRRLASRSPHFLASATAPQRTVPDPSERVNVRTNASKHSKIIVPGKFDAFHVGHRELARVAATLGTPTLLSFSGMAEALHWAPRAPVVAVVDRDRILRSWGGYVGKNVVYKSLPFAAVKEDSPEEFLEMLVRKFGCAGVVCGKDWRFGKMAMGDVGVLQRVGGELGMEIKVVDGVEIGEGEDGVVSSTLVREALGTGNVAKVAKMLGRWHRLVGYVGGAGGGFVDCNRFINQVPGDGVYECVVRVIGKKEPFRTTVSVERPEKVDPLVPVGLLDDPDKVIVRIQDAEVIYCIDCEVYLDFVERIA